MKKGIRFIFFIIFVFSILGCSTLTKREKYSADGFFKAKKMPYYPTYTVYNEEVTLMHGFGLVSIVGIPIVFLDYVGSTIFDTIMLPVDIYRNNITIKKRAQAEEIEYQ